MSVNSEGVPLFAGVESIDDMFIATMEEYDKEVGVEIDIPHPFWHFLKSGNHIEYRNSIGTHVPIKLLDKPNSTVKSFSHYDDVDNTPQDALSEAKFAYGHVVGTQMYSREELVKNSGDEQLVDMVQTKREQLEVSMHNHFGNLVMGDQDANGRDFMGFGRVLAFDQPCGGIDPTNDGFGYWNPQQGLKAGGGQFSLATEMRAGIRRLTRLCTYRRGSTPNVLVAGEDLFDEMQAYAEEKLRITIDELKDTKGWGDFNMFPFHNQTVIYDEALDPKEGWLLSVGKKKDVRVRIHKGTNFVFEPWQMMEKKVAKKRDCLVYASIYVKKRNANGRIVFS